MADNHEKPDLRPVPYENGSYCRVKQQTLTVVLKNYGTGDASPTTTQVDFNGFGTCKDPNNRNPQERPTKALRVGELIELQFDCPAQNCFCPECVFYITVDVKNELPDPVDLANKVTRAVCFKLPDLVPLRDETTCDSATGKLYVTVQNQGTEYARPSTTRVQFAGTDQFKDAETKGLEPGEKIRLTIDIPSALSGKSFDYTVNVDWNKVVEESNKDNNVLHRSCG